jgi:hypothetical protein
MSISFSLPDAIETQLRLRIDNVDETAKEAALVELYRMGTLSHGELATSLGKSRDETDGVLQAHGVTEDLLTIAEFDEQAASLRKLLAQ